MNDAKLSRRTVLRCGAALGSVALACGCARSTGASSAAQFATSDSKAESPKPAHDAPQATDAPKKGRWLAMWFSYLDFAKLDFSSEEAFRTGFAAVADHCAALGLNTMLVQVRPFGDALYQSSLYPWSHLCTGTQGVDPGFDPLDVMLAEAHSRALSLEAWLNPYRLRLNANTPAALADTGLATVHPEWCVSVQDGLYLNPAIPEAADYVVQGVEELIEHYAVDGIHFDDYFYPTTEESIDAAQYAAAGTAESLEDWRRANVTRLVKNAYNAVKAKDPTLRFGISPQGNPDNNFGQQYSDVATWMAGDTPIVDYICPQIYWGFHYTLKSGSDRFAFENITAEWLGMDRSAAVSLYFGLGAWRIGDGDGGQNPDSITQWQSGHNLADQIETISEADGWALYRYDSLFASAYPALAQAEAEAITALNKAQ